MTALAVTAATLRRLLRDRTAMFFVVVLPVAVILLIGLTVRGTGALRIGLVSTGQGELADRVAAAVRASPALQTTQYDDLAAARTALRRAELSAVVVLPADVDARLQAGSTVHVTIFAAPGSTSASAVDSAVSAALDSVTARTQAAGFAGSTTGAGFEEGLRAADRVAAVVPSVTVVSDRVNGDSDFLPLGFSYSAPTMLVLFVFVNAMAGGAAVIQTRDLGIYARALAAPVRTRQLIVGETLGYLTLALLQSALIITIGAVFFGVRWGDPLGALALVTTWALVGTGAGMLSGALFRTPEQASSIGPTIGIAAGMLGGCMWPLAIVPSAMRDAGHLLPHAWAVDSWVVLLSRGGGLADIAGRLLVLAAYAVGLLALASWRLRRRVAG